MHVLPWQTDSQAQLKNLVQQPAVATLIHGPRGIGKHVLSDYLVRYLLCLQANTTACGVCRACVLLEAMTHIDLLQFDGNELNSIKVSDVRTIIDFAQSTPQTSNRKVIYIKEADRLTSAAQNALLKIVEEPPQSVHFILTTDRLGQIKQTVRSRTALMRAPLPNPLQAADYLAEQTSLDTNTILQLLELGYMPVTIQLEQEQLVALQKLSVQVLGSVANGAEPLNYSDKFNKFEIIEVLDCLSKIIQLTYKVAMGISLTPIESKNFGLKLVMRDHRIKLFDIVDRMNDAMKGYKAGINLNKQLLLDCILCKWQELACSN